MKTAFSRSLSSLLASGEDHLLALCLGLMMLIPITESVLRKCFDAGISGSSSIVQHLTLAVGMLGGVIASRSGRLLSLSTAAVALEGHWKTVAHAISQGAAAAISFFLALAAGSFVLVERASGKSFVYGIPLWWIETILPLGFAVIALRLVWYATANAAFKAVAAGLALAVIACGFALPFSGWAIVGCAIGLVLAAFCGAPIFAILAGIALIAFRASESPIASMAIQHYRVTVNPTAPAIPLFTLAGYFLAEGGAAKRLVAVFQTCFGQLRGGPAIATAMVCAFSTSFTGASGVTILALGGVLMPTLVAARYSDKNALGLITGAGSLGLLIPPCLPLLLYAVVAEVPIEGIFVAGVLPGLLLILLTIGWGWSIAPKSIGTSNRFQWRPALKALWVAKWELLVPVVALTALFSGWATAIEAAALTALYSLFVETIIYRDLHFGKVPQVMAECGLLVGGVLLILGVALGLTNYLVLAQVPDRAVEWVQGVIHSRWLFLLALNLLLLVVGCLMDVFSAIVVIAPILVPVGAAYGIDPLHLGIIFLANLELGFLTPPVGMNLFLSSYRFNKPVAEVTRASLPMLGVLSAGVVAITYLPWLSTMLPNYLRLE